MLYHKLPSQVLAHGNSIDIRTAELAVGYEAYCNKKARDEADGKSTAKHTQQDLLNMVSRANAMNNE